MAVAKIDDEPIERVNSSQSMAFANNTFADNPWVGTGAMSMPSTHHPQRFDSYASAPTQYATEQSAAFPQQQFNTGYNNQDMQFSSFLTSDPFTSAPSQTMTVQTPTQQFMASRPRHGLTDMANHGQQQSTAYTSGTSDQNVYTAPAYSHGMDSEDMQMSSGYNQGMSQQGGGLNMQSLGRLQELLRERGGNMFQDLSGLPMTGQGHAIPAADTTGYHNDEMDEDGTGMTTRDMLFDMMRRRKADDDFE